jgi:hypothetical protein
MGKESANSDLPLGVTQSEKETRPTNGAESGEESRDKESEVAKQIELFVKQTDSLAHTLPTTMLLINAFLEGATKKRKEFIDSCESIPGGPPTKIRIPTDRHQDFVKCDTDYYRAALASQSVPRSFLVSLISQFDAYVGGLTRAFLYVVPELLSASERVLTFKELNEFSSMVEAREYIVEKEVESLLRKSHAEQFEWMENKFKIKLRVELNSWATFIEVTERRNLFVHCDGVVSRQYLRNCKEHGVPSISDVVIGKRLQVNKKYFETAANCVLEIGVKLGSVLWRKLNPSERRVADDQLNSICFRLIGEGNYELAKNLLDFASVTLKTHTSDEARRVFVVNRAQTYKWLGDLAGTKSILDSEDWSACDDKFKIAVAVLRDEYSQAAKLMRIIGPDGSVKKAFYRSWPLFKEFRKTSDCRTTFEKVFGEPLETNEADITTKPEMDGGPSEFSSKPN